MFLDSLSERIPAEYLRENENAVLDDNRVGEGGGG